MSSSSGGGAATVSAGSAVPPGTTQQHALHWLREAIVVGELAPGERVPQDAIAERIGVSVVPLREALRVLEGEGQIVYRPRRGYFVAELALAELEEIYELRRLLETRAVELALPVWDADSDARMLAAAEECASQGSETEIAAKLAANRRFHLAVLGSAGAPHLMRLIVQLWDSTEAYRAMYYNLPHEREAADRAHRAIAAAVLERDGARVIAAQDAHREAALESLRAILPRESGAAPTLPG